MRVLVLVALVLASAGCGAAEERRAADAGGEHISGHGLSLVLPAGWHGDMTKLGTEDAATIRAATFPLGKRTDLGQSAQRTMGPDDLLVVVADYGVVPGGGAAPRAALPVRLGREHVVDFEGFREPVATTGFFADGSTLQVWVVAAGAPTDLQLEGANAVLATLRYSAARRTHDDEEYGIAATVPNGWYAARALTRLAEPREVLALASYPLRGGGEAGECAPNTARSDMPPGGAFVWLLEYREQLPPERFPPRPRPFRLDRGQLAEHVACFPGPGWSAAFGAAGRQFQLLVAFGGPPTDRRLREVEEALDSLAFDRLPPADPSIAWPLLVGSTPDSMRAPPGWAAAPAWFSPADEPRPRTLFFAASRSLFGLPAQLEREAQRLPAPLPSAALAKDFPRDGVLLWVVEEGERRTLAQHFRPIDRDWPGRDDFEPVDIATKPNPELRWLVAAGEFRGHRFSVWIARGPDASDADVALALQSAATLAVSGCDRGVGARCEENG